MANNFLIVDEISATDKLVRFCKEQTEFQQGHSKYGTLWSVWECPLLATSMGEELKTKFEIEPFNILLSKTGKEGLPRHFDINKWSVLNIPIKGDFVESPLVFVDDMDNIVESSDYGNGKKSILFNARVNHAVLPSKSERLVLSICWKVPFEQIRHAYENKRLLKYTANDLFHYQNF